MWHTAVLTRAERLPSLEELLGGEPAEAGPQSPEEIDLTMRRWRIAMAVADAG